MTTRWVLYRFIPKVAVLAGVIGLGLLLYSEAGLRWVWRQVEPHLAPTVQIGSVSGRLLDKIVVKELRVDTPALKLSVGTAWVDWRPSALLGFSLQIDEIVALNIDGQSLPVEDKGPPAQGGELPETLPRLPTVIVEKLRIGNLVWRDATGQPSIEVRRARLAARVGPDAVQASVHELDLAGWGAFALGLRGKVSPRRIRIDSLDVSGPNRLAVALEAACEWPGLECQAQADFRNLGWPLVAPEWQVPEGRVEVNGSPQRYRASAELALIGPDLPRQALTVALAGDSAALDHFELTAHSLAGELDAAGSLAWSDGIALDMDLALKEYDIASWAPEWPSRLNGGGSIQVAYGMDLRVDAPDFRIEGSLRDEPVAVRASIATRDRVVDVSDLSLEWADTRAHGVISIGHAVAGMLELEAPDLERLDARARGRVKAEVAVAGTLKRPELRGHLVGDGLHFERVGVEALNGEVDLQWRRQGRSVARLMATGIDAGGEPVDSASLTINGSLDDFALEWTLSAPAASTNGRVTGEFDPAGLGATITVTALRVAENTLGEWSLVSPVRLAHVTGRTRIEELCLGSDGTRACAQAQVDGQTVQGQLRLTPVELSRFAMLWSSSTRVMGTAALEVDIPPSPLSNPSADIVVDLSPVTVTSVDRRESIEVLKLAAGRVRAGLRDGTLSGSLQLPGVDDGGLQGEFTVEPQALSARLEVDIRDLDVLTVVNPEIVEIDGTLHGTLTLGGSPRQPELGGRLSLTAQTLVLDTPNIELTDVSVGISGRGRSSLTLDGHARSGDGTMNLSGQVDWSAERPTVEARLVGDNFLASNSELARVRVSPNLSLKLRERQLHVGGSVHVPLAHINVTEIEKNGRLAPSGDEFVIGEDDREPAIRVTSDVRLSLGDDVRFSGFGLKTRIAGKLRTQSTSGSVATATGELQLLEGRYKAYGQDLVIERGRLLFSGGAISEPGLDFRAYRQARVDIRAGVQVRGSLRAPEFTLYSDPAMRETDQLSYLVLGRSAEAQSESDQAALNNAALALGLQGGDFLAQKVKGRIGLDEVKIGAQPGESADQAALILGKYLTPDLYVSYGIGLFEPTYEFRMRYRLTDRWLLQTESGVESGGDIFYTIER